MQKLHNEQIPKFLISTTCCCYIIPLHFFVHQKSGFQTAWGSQALETITSPAGHVDEGSKLCECRQIG